MSARMTVLEVIAVVAGAVIGLLALDFASWLFADTSFFALLASPGRILVALVTVGLFAFY